MVLQLEHEQSECKPDRAQPSKKSELSMKEPMVGSFLYGDHKAPKKSRPWQERVKLPGIVVALFIVLGFLSYKYCNYRQEHSVAEFLAYASNGQIDAAFAKWDIVAGGSYTMKDFVSDWGKDGYYMKGARTAKVIDSNSRGPDVTVYVAIDTFQVPLALRVNKETLKLSYAPNNKYKARAQASK
jgi:hypothetical protein